jgi:hypothetical protein
MRGQISKPFLTAAAAGLATGTALFQLYDSFSSSPDTDQDIETPATDITQTDKCDYPEYNNCSFNLGNGLEAHFPDVERYWQARDKIHLDTDYDVNGHSVSVPEDVNEAIGLLSTITPIQNPHFWRSIAFAESGFDSDAVSTSNARGLFQIKVSNVPELLYKIKQDGRFLDYIPEAKHIRRRYTNGHAHYYLEGLPGADLEALSRQLLDDPVANGLLAYTYWRVYADIEDTPEVNVIDVYLKHFLGKTGAEDFLEFARTNPGAPAYAHFGKESPTVQNNLGVFKRDKDEWRSAEEVIAYFRDKRGLNATVQIAPHDTLSEVRLAGRFKQPERPVGKPHIPLWAQKITQSSAEDPFPKPRAMPYAIRALRGPS